MEEEKEEPHSWFLLSLKVNLINLLLDFRPAVRFISILSMLLVNIQENQQKIIPALSLCFNHSLRLVSISILIEIAFS